MTPEPAFCKSSRSNNTGEACVEVALNLPGTVLVRDSKQNGTGPVLEFSPGDWLALLADRPMYPGQIIV